MRLEMLCSTWDLFAQQQEPKSGCSVVALCALHCSFSSSDCLWCLPFSVKLPRPSLRLCYSSVGFCLLLCFIFMPEVWSASSLHVFHPLPSTHLLSFFIVFTITLFTVVFNELFLHRGDLLCFIVHCFCCGLQLRPFTSADAQLVKAHYA